MTSLETREIQFSDIESILWQMQCELRNKEGITGINAMHHMNLILLIRALDKEQCKKLGIPEGLSFDNIKDLISKDLFEKVYNPSNIKSCLLFHIRYNERFGFNKDIPFEIKNESTIHYLLLKAKEIDTRYMFDKTDLIGDIYELFINREGKTMKDLGQYFTDRDLINYLVRLSNPQVKNGVIETIYDGACGTGGFLTQSIKHLNDNNPDINWEQNRYNVYGTDINKNTFALLKLNLFFTTGEFMDNLSMQDTLVKNSPIENGFDNILMNPPFGIKGLKYAHMNEKLKSLKIDGTKGEILFLQNCMVNLAKGGRCCIVVPDGVLFNGTNMYKKTRKHLLENFELEKVIKVGEGEFFKNTGVKTAVLFFRNTGEKTQHVDFVQVNKVNGRIEEVPLMTVEMDKIIENDYSLNMNLYKEVVFGVCNDFDMVKIEDIITEFKSGKYIPNTNGTLYPYYNSNGIIGNMDTFMFDGEYIIQATSGSGINENTFYYNGKFNATNFTTIFKTKANCLVKYLYYFIRIKLNIREQCCNGSTIPNLDKKSFVRIKIPLPPLDHQQQIVNQLDNIYENEIDNSKKTIEGLEKSIEGMMKNTMMRSDNTIEQVKSILKIKKGPGHKVSEGKETGLYPLLRSSIDGKVKWIDTFDYEGPNIIIGTGGCFNIHYYVSRFSVSGGCGGGGKMLVLEPKDDDVNLKYLYYSIKYMKDIINEMYRGSALKHLDTQEFDNLKIHIPPINIQNQIVEKVNQKENLINLLKENMNNAVSQANDIMSQLFTN